MIKQVLKFSAFFSLICILFVACKKHGDNEDLNDTNDPISGFMSTKAGSWWLYASEDGTVLKRRATGRDSEKMGLTYNYYESTDTSTGHVTPEYFAKNGDKYIMLIDLDGKEENYLTAVVQKENPQVGDTWENTGTVKFDGFPKIDVLIEGSVMAVNGKMTVNGHTYTNVTQINNVLKAKTSNPPSPYINCGTAQMWFSEGIGVVRTEFHINVMSIIKKEYTDSLIDYHIEP